MISVELAREIAERIEKKEAAEVILKVLNDGGYAGVVITMEAKGHCEPFTTKILHGKGEVKQMIEFIINLHKERLTALNEKAADQAQSDNTKGDKCPWK